MNGLVIRRLGVYAAERLSDLEWGAILEDAGVADVSSGQNAKVCRFSDLPTCGVHRVESMRSSLLSCSDNLDDTASSTHPAPGVRSFWWMLEAIWLGSSIT
jgi:hypothetical protein